ncbi:MAG: hypothetical protein ACLPN1_16635 [Dissulfurispiraceae bacterium]
MITTIIKFIGLWLFSVMVYKINQTNSPNEYDETRRRVEDLIADGEIDLEEVTPQFVRGMLRLDMLVRTSLVAIFCMALWNIFT